MRTARLELVVELFKPLGRRVELGVEPGSYEVRIEREAAALLARPTVAEGARVVLEPAQFTSTTKEPTRAGRLRGRSTAPPGAFRPTTLAGDAGIVIAHSHSR